MAIRSSNGLISVGANQGIMAWQTDFELNRLQAELRH